MRELKGWLDGNQLNIGVVVSRFHEKITTLLLDGAYSRLTELGVVPEKITVAHVPGAWEIPLVAMKMAKSGRYDAIITLGCVIRQETAHFDYVCNECSAGITRAALDTGVPVIAGVLTTFDEQQALERAGEGGFNRAIDWAEAAIEMVSLLKQIG